ncbi:hypothetical protein B0H14DRAFT_3570550 [Mycena olivaceomarginata]|nr:hypothetical protein B0H14DRAFT_3570550 [Mycena olivaceomarginata]
MTPHHLLQVPSPALVIPLALHLAPVHCRLRRTCTVYVHHQCSQGCVHGAWGSALPPAVDLSVKQLLDAIPAHCFKRSALKSSVYTLWHLSIGGISKTAAYADTFINRRLSRRRILLCTPSCGSLCGPYLIRRPQCLLVIKDPAREPDDAAQRHPVVCVAPLPLPHPPRAARAAPGRLDEIDMGLSSSRVRRRADAGAGEPAAVAARERGEVLAPGCCRAEEKAGAKRGEDVEMGEEEQQHGGDTASPSAMQCSTLAVQFANTDARSPTANPTHAHTAPASFSSSRPAPSRTHNHDEHRPRCS